MLSLTYLQTSSITGPLGEPPSIVNLAIDLKIHDYHSAICSSVSAIKTFGTIDCQMELMHSSWQAMSHVFSVQATQTTLSTLKVTPAPTTTYQPRPMSNLLTLPGLVPHSEFTEALFF
jgi:hypothetical protein